MALGPQHRPAGHQLDGHVLDRALGRAGPRPRAAAVCERLAPRLQPLLLVRPRRRRPAAHTGPARLSDSRPHSTRGWRCHLSPRLVPAFGTAQLLVWDQKGHRADVHRRRRAAPRLGWLAAKAGRRGQLELPRLGGRVRARRH
eukprot:3719558-Prymnesium_polylepis.1